MLDHLIPLPRLLETDHADLAAPARDVWEVLRHGNLARSPFVKALFELRTLPDRLHGRVEDLRLKLDELTSTPDRPGFQILGEEPGREVAVAAIGKVWHLEIPFVHVANAADFAAFEAPDFVKVAWAIRVTPRGERDSHVEFELRLDATDDEAWRKFQRYFALIGPFSHFIRRSVLASLQREFGQPEAATLEHPAARVEGPPSRDNLADVLEGVEGLAVMTFALLTPLGRAGRRHWGVDAATAERTYPGDELVPEPLWDWTHGVEIDTPVAAVWPWIAQIGADRAGFYSYQWLENLAGCNVRNADRVNPEWAARVGNELLLHPDPKTPRLRIVAAVPDHYLLAHGAPDEKHRERGDAWSTASWLFFLEPLGTERCRLISRYRVACSGDLATRFAFGPAVLEPVGFAMDRRMLLGVKQRAELVGSN